MVSLKRMHGLLVLSAVFLLLLLPLVEGRDIFREREMAKKPIVGVWLWDSGATVYFFPNQTSKSIETDGKINKNGLWKFHTDYSEEPDSEYMIGDGAFWWCYFRISDGENGKKELWGWGGASKYPKDKPHKFAAWIGDISLPPIADFDLQLPPLLVPITEGRDIFREREMAKKPIVGVWLWDSGATVYFFPNQTSKSIETDGKINKNGLWKFHTDYSEEPDSEYMIGDGAFWWCYFKISNGENGKKELWGWGGASKYPKDKPHKFAIWRGDILLSSDETVPASLTPPSDSTPTTETEETITKKDDKSAADSSGSSTTTTSTATTGETAASKGDTIAGGTTSGVDLTGVWNCDDGGTYYIRQDGNTIWWYGEPSPTDPAWSNVAYGTISGDTVSLMWSDVPKGGTLNGGTLTLQVLSNDRLTAVEKTGGHGGLNWWRGAAQGKPAEIAAAPNPWEDPKVRSLIDEWLRQQENCLKKTEPKAYVDKWGRICGEMPGAIITCSVDPDKPAGVTDNYHYLWHEDFCLGTSYPYTVRDYVTLRLEGKSFEELAACNKRNGAPCSRLSGEMKMPLGQVTAVDIDY